LERARGGAGLAKARVPLNLINPFER
jgi:hypothetical protein